MESSPLRLTPQSAFDLDPIQVVGKAVADALWPFRPTGILAESYFDIDFREWIVRITVQPWGWEYKWSGDALEEAVIFHVANGAFDHFRNIRIKPEANIVLGED